MKGEQLCTYAKLPFRYLCRVPLRVLFMKMSSRDGSARAAQASDDATSSDDEIARQAATVAVTTEDVEAFVADAQRKSIQQKVQNIRSTPTDVAHHVDIGQRIVTWKDLFHSAIIGQALDGTQMKVAAQLDKMLAASLEFTHMQHPDCDLHVSQPLRGSDVGRLFQAATPSMNGEFTVFWQSEYSVLQSQTPAAAKQASKIYDKKHQHFRNMKDEQLQAIAVSGEQLMAYAELAAYNAKKRIRPVSKQENLGPKRIVRCGWGGGEPVFETLSLHHKLHQTSCSHQHTA